MAYKDYYQILGINKNASSEEIRKAYRRLAAKYHPDKNPNDSAAAEKFKEINEAHQVLGNSEKRKMYDQFGEDWKHYKQTGQDFDRSKYAKQKGGERRRYHTNFDFGDIFGRSSPDDLFDILFGQGFTETAGRQKREFNGADLTAEITITLEEAYQGITKLFNTNGQTIKLNIHRGIKDKQILRLPGKGASGFGGGKNGDLLLIIKIIAHPNFQRKENDLYCDLSVDLYTAVLGGKVNLKTLKGTIKVNIPQETEGDKILRLTGLGMPFYNNNRYGDLYVKILVQIPKGLNKKELELFQELKRMREK
jgi:curved DNA-binding protein